MNAPVTKITILAGILATLLLLPDEAEAFRCKNKIVREDMHEQQVIAICGQPTTRRQIGYAIRGYTARPRGSSGSSRRYGYGLSEEVIVTEYVYNFGPRKLMRRLVFEGGVLVRIESIGYGYIEK